MTGYLRIAADRHYFTDVLVAAVVGAGAGVGIPFAHLLPQPRGVTLHVSTLPFSGGAGLVLAGRW
jgi:membrane-associated phospholipid phosphatase